MNQTSSGLSVSKALVGFLNTKAAEGLSPRTLQSYEHRIKQWIDYAGEVEVVSVTPQTIRRYLAWLRTDYKPKRFNGDSQPLSPKTICNIYVTLSSFFTWASTEFDIDSPMKGVPTPKYTPAPVVPFTRDDIDAMLDVCEFTRGANTTDRRWFRRRRATSRRDRAIILTLLDTGLRASELCALMVADVDLKTGRVEVRHGPRGGAKGWMATENNWSFSPKYSG